MSDLEINPYVYFAERELQYKPTHFVQTKTAITLESRKWINNKLKGRFCVVNLEKLYNMMEISNTNIIVEGLNGYPAFEDPAEATFYELTWS